MLEDQHNNHLKGGLDLDHYKALMNNPPVSKEGLEAYINSVHERSRSLLLNNANVNIACNTSDGKKTAYDLMLSDFGHQYYHLGQIYAVFRLIDLTTPDYDGPLKQ